MNDLKVVLVDVIGEVLEIVNKEIVWLNFGEDKMNGFLLIELKYWFLDFEVNWFDLFVVIVLEKFINGFKSIVF